MSKIESLFSLPEQDVLYHYTSQQGLLGILRDRQIWASKIQYLNDTQELRLALDLARRSLEGSRQIARKGEEDWEVEEMLEDLGGVENVNICVASFSEEKDQLSQWRAYGGQHGYALGFKPKSLFRVEWRSFSLMRCEYRPDEQTAIMKELVEHKLALEREHSAGKQPNSAQRLHRFIDPLDSLGQMALQIAPALKHESFREEKEWRLVSRPVNSSRLEFRAGGSMIIPYYECKLSGKDSSGAHSQAQLVEIVVGPCPHMDQAVAALQQLIFKEDLTEGCVVSRSRIPYRNW